MTTKVHFKFGCRMLSGELMSNAVLPLATGLLWGMGLVKIGLSSSFPIASFQLSEAALNGMLASYVVTFLFLIPKMSESRRFFTRARSVAIFSVLFGLGALQFLFPYFIEPYGYVWAFVGSAMHAAGNVFFLCALAVAYMNLDGTRRAKNLLFGSAIACLVFTASASLSPAALRIAYVIGLIAFLVSFFFIAGTTSTDGSTRLRAAYTKYTYFQYSLFGFCMGSILGMGLTKDNNASMSWIFVVGIIVFTIALVRFLYPRTTRALGVAQVVVLVIGAFALLPLDIPLHSLLYALLVFSWLVFWAFLLSGAPFAAKGSTVSPLALLVAFFAAGRVAMGFVANEFGDVIPRQLEAASFAFAIIAVIIPIYEILSSFELLRASAISAEQTESGALPASCKKIADAFGLTPRELDVLLLLSQGRSRQHISEALVISEGTAKTHIKRIYAKIGVHSKDELLDLVHSHCRQPLGE